MYDDVTHGNDDDNGIVYALYDDVTHGNDDDVSDVILGNDAVQSERL